MKILHIINSLNTGGAEKLVVDAIPHYVKKGITTNLLLLNGANTVFKNKLENENCCTIYSLGLSSVYNPLLVFKIIPYLKKYDVVHVHLFPAQYWVVFAKLLSFSKTKILFTEHNTTNKRLENKLYKFIDRFIYKFYTKIICISTEIYEIVKAHSNLKANRLTVIENGVDLTVYKNAEKVDVKKLIPIYNSTTKIIIQVSGFRAQKDQPTLIKAMQYLPKNFKLLLVGEGVLKKDCEQLVKQLNLESSVLFLGVRADVPQLLKTADIVVLSSKYEGLSLSSIEGMASGKPFIASNVPGLKNVVSSAGILFKQGDDEELASQIKQLILHEEYYKKISELCLARAEKYDSSVMVNKHIALYKSIVNEN